MHTKEEDTLKTINLDYFQVYGHNRFLLSISCIHAKFQRLEEFICTFKYTY